MDTQMQTTLHSPEAEAAYLGALLTDPENYETAKVSTVDFFIHRNRWVYEAMVRLRENNQTIDSLTVTDELARMGKLEEIGGPAYLVNLITACQNSTEAEKLAKTITEWAERREKKQAAEELIQEALAGLPIEQGNEYDIETCLNNQERGDAELMQTLFTGKIVYDHTEGQWYQWLAGHWLPDKTRNVDNLVCRDIASLYAHEAAECIADGEADKAKEYTKRARSLMTRRKIDNVLFMAANQPELKIVGYEWDRVETIKEILPVINGVIELKTGELRPARPDEYIRARSPIAWRGLDAPCPKWEQTLFEIFAGNEELVPFLQRLCGYAISGFSKEHIFPMLHGPEGRNGKGTIVETLSYVLGEDLAMEVPADALMDLKQNGAGTQPYIYNLKGKRLVWASESETGRRLNAGLVKQLAGGDTITAHTKYKAPISFRPTHTIFFITNHEPHIDGDDSAMWARVLKIPFTQRFVSDPKAPNEHEANLNLPDELKAEASGILAWLVRGFIAWQKEGLDVPDLVRISTNDYRQDEDSLGEFAEDCLVFDVSMFATNAQISEVYEKWCFKNGEKNPMNGRTLRKKLRERYGLKLGRETIAPQARGLDGVGVRYE